MNNKPTPPAAASPFENEPFKGVLRQILSVPKAEIDKREKEWKRKKDRRAKKN